MSDDQVHLVTAPVYWSGDNESNLRRGDNGAAVDGVDANENASNMSATESGKTQPQKIENAENRGGFVPNGDIDGHTEEPDEMRLGKIERAITMDDAPTLKDLLPTEYINEVFNLVWASAVGSTRVVEDLLNRGADVLSELGKVEFWTLDEVPDDFCSAFHLAAMNGHTDVLKKLFERNPELLELHTERGETALFLAAQAGRVDAVQYLLQRGADPAATSQSLTQTALHVACSHGYGKVCQALLSSILRMGDRTLSRAIILAKDSANRTPFNLAAENRHTRILLQLLETPVYFPRYLFKDGITPPDIADKEAWRAYMPLDSWRQRAGDVELSQHGAAVGYWALTQREGFSNFVSICDKVPLNRAGASWVHVAAVGGDVKVMEHFARDSRMLMTPGIDGIRPLHIAAACGHLPLVQYMLPKLYSWYTDDLYTDPLEAHLNATEQGTTAVEFAAVGGPGQQNEVEQFLWDEVHRLVGKQHEELEDGFFRSYVTNRIAGDVLELAAKCATPGKEDKLLWFFQLLERDIEKQWDCRPEPKLGLEDGRNALHWAIYFQKPTLVWWLLGNGTYTGEADIRHGLYINRECDLIGPLSDRHANTLIQELLSDSPPMVKRPVLSGYNDAPSFKYNLQRYRDDTRAAIADFYNIQGQSHLQLKRRAIRDILSERGPQKIMHLSRYPDAKALTERLQHLRGNLHWDVSEAIPPETHDLRWFHFSSNDLACVELPYLSWMEWPPKMGKSDSGPDREMAEDNIQHEPLTLDQYYYVSLDDTQERDNSQVLGRYIKREEERTGTTKSSTPAERHLRPLQHDRGSPKNTQSKQDLGRGQIKKATPILSISQLWLWILNGKTIITCTSEGPQGVNQRFMFNKLKAHSKNSTVSAESVVEVIARAAVGLLNEKLVPVIDTKVSPLEAFRASIGYVRSSEADLFREFELSLKDEQLHANHNISRETMLLREVKDICDELNILKTLAEDQENVWQQAWTVVGGKETVFSTNTPSDNRKMILAMIHDATTVQKSLDTLLDLKQKQANLTEVKITRKQAQDTAKQTDTVVWFTVVTIIFLPLSFLTSLFALNVSDFPHSGDEVAYQGWWIFPVIFGVSTIVSAFFLSIAFKASAIKILFKNGWEHMKNINEKMLNRGHTTSPALDDKMAGNAKEVLTEKVTDFEGEEASAITRIIDIDQASTNIVGTLLENQTTAFKIANIYEDFPQHVIGFRKHYALAMLPTLTEYGADMLRLWISSDLSSFVSKAWDLTSVRRLGDEGRDTLFEDIDGLSPSHYTLEEGY
ncbi:hypothetical protein HFD88_005523 [Aspergillus terreus]|nr:hypothetical protein HFD88_005523 [Aspergillus terreus]